MTGTKFHNLRFDIRKRCNNVKYKQYKDYWWRWIKCEWNSFEQFRKDMYSSYIEHTKYNSYTSIDRIDNNWNYCKENCRRATRDIQRNNSSQNVYIEYNWETNTLNNICKKYKKKYALVQCRLKRWWNIDMAMNKQLTPHWYRVNT